MLDEPLGSRRADRNHPIPVDFGVELPTANLFVGRGAELAELAAGLDTAMGGHGRLFLISGEPGIGKTRLAAEFTSAARSRGALVHWGRCWEAGGAPSYWPWVEVIRQVLRGVDPPTPGDLGRHASYLVQLVPELADQLGTTLDAAPPPADPDSARFYVFDAVAALLRCAASRRPLVVIVDDFHVADRASALLLAFLARTLADCPVLFIGTYRDHEARASEDLVEPLAELARHARRLTLRGLAAKDVTLLIENAAGRRPSHRLVTSIHGVTDGNPFFVDEILRLLASQGRLGEASDATTPSLGIPDGVREAVRRRLEPLAEESTPMLELAAVTGREFDASVLRVAADLDLIAVVDALDQPARHGLILPVPGATGRFSFRHALIRDVVYDGLSPARRLRLHRQIGEAFETLSAGDPDRYVAELAHHFLAAAPCGQDDRFVEHGARAARQALRRMAFEDAVALYQRTIDALNYARPDERRRCELLLALAEAKEWANDPRGSRAAAEQVAAIARRLEAADLLAKAALVVGGIDALKSTASSRCDGAADLLQEALQVVSPHETATRARLRSRLALQQLATGSRAKALGVSAEAVVEARHSGDREALAHALIARHAVLLGPDYLDERSAIARELLELATALGSREFEMRGLALRLMNHFDLGEIQALEEALEQHARLAEETSDPFERWINLMGRSARALLIGQFEEAKRLSRQAFELTRSVPGPHAFEANGPMSYVAQTILIQDAEYSDVPDSRIPDPDLIGYYRARHPEVACWHVASLHQLTRLRRIEAVRREVDVLAARNFTDLERNSTWLAAMSYLSEAVALISDRERAAILYPMLLPYSELNATISFITTRGSIGRSLGLLAVTMGEHADAIRHFEAALATNRRMGARPQVAVTLLDYAKTLLRRSDSGTVSQARELVEQARAIAQELGMDGLANECAVLLERRGDLDGGVIGSPLATHFHLAKDGQFWTLSRAGQRILLKDAKGLTYLAELLRHPNRDIHALDLLALLAGTSAGETCASTAGAAEGLAPDERGGAADEVLDARARHAYQRQLATLQEQLEAAEAAAEPERILALRQEVDSLRRELARATGLGGRSRRASNAERARVNVTRTIRLALTRIVEVSPELGSDLAQQIRTGTFCCYAPDRAST